MYFGLFSFDVHVYVGIPKSTHPHRRMDIIFVACRFGVIKYYGAHYIVIQRGRVFFMIIANVLELWGSLKLESLTFYMVL